jgi:hydroxymethylpyrimidine pyrophosphatase-like HAD family hydrolase
MLAWAGRPYAVASGHPAVLAAVTGRVLPPEQDGVARELELLFDL